MVEPAHQQEDQREARRQAEQEDHRPVARAFDVHRHEQPAAGGHGLAQADRDELARDRVDQLDELHRKQPERDAAQRQPDQAGALPGPGRVRVQQALLARLTEEDDAEELDHDVAGEGRDQRDQRGDDRDQHVEEGARQARREQEALQQQPFGDEAVQRRQAGAGERADQREPGDPGHVADQAAELAEAALAGRVQHRAGADEEQALEERVVGNVVEHRGQRQGRHRLHAVGREQHRQAEPDDRRGRCSRSTNRRAAASCRPGPRRTRRRRGRLRGRARAGSRPTTRAAPAAGRR